MSATPQDYKNAFIDTYRIAIEKRYQVEYLRKNFDLSEAYNEADVERVRSFFLTYVYPNSVTRGELDKAFESLSQFVKNPSIILFLIGNMAGAAWRFGFMLPKALKTAASALRSYVDAKAFEKHAVKILIQNKESLPLTVESLTACIQQMKTEDIMQFIEDIKTLLHALTDDKLVSKTAEVLEEVISIMKHKKDFTAHDISGIEFGLQILKNGLEIFKNFSSEQKNEIVDLIIQVEEDFVYNINSTNNS